MQNFGFIVSHIQMSLYSPVNSRKKRKKEEKERLYKVWCVEPPTGSNADHYCKNHRCQVLVEMTKKTRLVQKIFFHVLLNEIQLCHTLLGENVLNRFCQVLHIQHRTL